MLAFVVAALCAAADGGTPGLSAAELEALRGASKVELIRLKNDPREAHKSVPAKKNEPHVYGFAIKRMVRELSPTERVEFIALLEQQRSNPDAGPKSCGGFQPKVAFRFYRGNDFKDVSICFNCSDVGVSSAKPGDAKVIDISRQVPEFARFTKKVLPSDDGVFPVPVLFDEKALTRPPTAKKAESGER